MNQSDIPLAYHITIGAYGTRLYGRDERIIEEAPESSGESRLIGLDDGDWHRLDPAELQFEPVFFDETLRRRIEADAIPAVCTRGGWMLHVCAARSNHIHVLLTAKDQPDGATVRKWFKRWLTAAIDEVHAIPSGETARWWAKGGSVKAVWTKAHFERVRERVAVIRLRH